MDERSGHWRREREAWLFHALEYAHWENWRQDGHSWDQTKAESFSPGIRPVFVEANAPEGQPAQDTHTDAEGLKPPNLDQIRFAIIRL